jgi:hypothetical protein
MSSGGGNRRRGGGGSGAGAGAGGRGIKGGSFSNSPPRAGGPTPTPATSASASASNGTSGSAGPTASAWGKRTNPIIEAARSSPASAQATVSTPTAAVSSSPAGGLTKGSEAYTMACRDRFLAVARTLVGERVSVSMREGGVKHEGVMHTCTPFRDSKFMVILRAVRTTFGEIDQEEKHSSSLELDFADVVELHAPHFPISNNPLASRKEFATDHDISAAAPGTARQLQQVNNAWVAALPPGGAGLEEASHSRGKKWDQFEANEKLYGVKTSFDENLYTTELDKSKFSADKKKTAERLAREIEGKISSNPHMREERNQQTQQDYQMSEEMLYSGVRTSPPPSASSSNTNVYRPPALRDSSQSKKATEASSSHPAPASHQKNRKTTEEAEHQLQAVLDGKLRVSDAPKEGVVAGTDGGPVKQATKHEPEADAASVEGGTKSDVDAGKAKSGATEGQAQKLAKNDNAETPAKKSGLNPAAKEFKFNPNARSFAPGGGGGAGSGMPRGNMGMGGHGMQQMGMMGGPPMAGMPMAYPPNMYSGQQMMYPGAQQAQQMRMNMMGQFPYGQVPYGQMPMVGYGYPAGGGGARGMNQGQPMQPQQMAMAMGIYPQAARGPVGMGEGGQGDGNMLMPPRPPAHQASGKGPAGNSGAKAPGETSSTATEPEPSRKP